jgi:phenylalanyl-tRNA synthetase beta chain
MKVLQSWLRHYSAFKIPPDELADRLTMLGLEFENVEHLGEKYRGFVVGKVVECERHPNADKLSRCQVNIGNRTVQIVCGAPNVAAGQKVAVGLAGTTVPHNQHDPGGAPFVLSVVQIRGVESHGMICSEYELDLGNDADGIMVLDESAKVGQPLADYLGLEDVVYDVEITPNRPDWLSHAGIAREIGILTGKRPSAPEVRLKESATPIGKFLRVSVEDKKNCPRFAARMIRGVRIAPSPRWMQNALRNAGLRPINNVVDVTNYVMLDCGHPMHAFDHSLLAGGRIIVRQAEPGTRFTTLDGKDHTLPEGTVMVCDAEREVSVAGVMGGANSEIRESTTDVVLEAAYWNPSNIRRTAKALGISTDASQRFERGADPNVIPHALDRAAQLVLETAGGTLLKGRLDVYPKPIRPRPVTLRPSRVNTVLGTSLSRTQIVRFMNLLDVRPKVVGKDLIRCTIPTYRVDLEREIDLIEEVARIYGYDAIEEKTSASVDFSHPVGRERLADRLRTILVGLGFNEAITNSMHDQRRASLVPGTPVRILNPLSQDMAFLRTSLVPGLLDTVIRNKSFGNADLRFFEIGHVFRVDPASAQRLVGDFHEDERVCLLLTGQALPRQWGLPARAVDFFDLKGETAAFLSKITLDKWRFISYSTSDGLTDETLGVEIQGASAGYLGRVRSEVRDAFGIEQDVFIAEFVLSVLDVPDTRRFEPISRYPRVRRDVAFVLDRDISAGSVIEQIRESGGSLLQNVDLFDVYEGESLGGGKKSFAFALELMSREKTLTDAEIDAVVRGIAGSVEKRFGAVLRSAH